ncbi:MAG: DEAD/DEAH box helicase, partial [Thermomicrobiales bacterium]
ARRLEAMEWIAADFAGNRQTTHSAFALPDLATFTAKAPTLAAALDEFLTIERHVELAAWKGARHKPPEERVLDGEALVVTFHEGDQDPEMLARYRETQRRKALKETYRTAFLEAHPEAKRASYTPEQRAETEATWDGIAIRLRLASDGIACSLDEALALSSIKAGDWLVLAPRTEVDSRLPHADQRPYTPTAKSLLYRMRVILDRLEVERDAEGRAIAAFATIALLEHQGQTSPRAFTFKGHPVDLVDGDRYSLDPNPNDINGERAATVVEGLLAGGQNPVYAHLARQPEGLLPVTWPEAAIAAQARFLAGLDALQQAGALHPFAGTTRDYIGDHGGDPLLMVQGPPGTGKSYSTAFALFARMQGAMAAGLDCRISLTCTTHAAIDVLLDKLRGVQAEFREIAASYPGIWASFFDARLLEVPLFRVSPKEDLPDGVHGLSRDRAGWDRLAAERWTAVGATPGSIIGLARARKKTGESVFSHRLFDIAVLDEASQMSIPYAVMATLPLRPDGRLIVVGDHRQMPPIVKNDWGREVRRSFQEFRAYESLFLALLDVVPPSSVIRFAESFRLHAAMAEFLRQEIYRHDGIPYFSRRSKLLPPPKYPAADQFVQAVLDREHPLTVIVHEEESSQQRNRFEQDLMAPILEALADPGGYAFDAEHGLGVVVPHRAQRAALQEAIPALTIRDETTGEIRVSAVDTVERFQGDERTVIVIGATESDRAYLLENGEFLLDPRRLTVALSRAKEKLILVASRSVFELFSADEETFTNAQLWKNLRRTCEMLVWAGDRDGVRVEVLGNVPEPEPGAHLHPAPPA